MPRQKKIIITRLGPLKKKGDDFDLVFWNRIGIDGKFKAAWQMVLEAANWNKSHVTQQRLRRSVAFLKQRES